MNYFISGIGTNIGKTIASAILVRQLQYDYWKPIQCGDLDHTDSNSIAELIGESPIRIHPEAYKLKGAFSPHKSAALEGIRIELKNMQLPKTNNGLIIEGAGGLLVPINEEELMIHLIKSLDCEVVLVSQNYLGSINHTLLSLLALKHYNIPLKGIIINGDQDTYTENILFKDSSNVFLGRIPPLELLDSKHLGKISFAL